MRLNVVFTVQHEDNVDGRGRDPVVRILLGTPKGNWAFTDLYIKYSTCRRALRPEQKWPSRHPSLCWQQLRCTDSGHTSTRCADLHCPRSGDKIDVSIQIYLQPTLNSVLYTDTVSAARGRGRVIHSVSCGVVALLDQDII